MYCSCQMHLRNKHMNGACSTQIVTQSNDVSLVSITPHQYRLLERKLWNNFRVSIEKFSKTFVGCWMSEKRTWAVQNIFTQFPPDNLVTRLTNASPIFSTRKIYTLCDIYVFVDAHYCAPSASSMAKHSAQWFTNWQDWSRMYEQPN